MVESNLPGYEYNHNVSHHQGGADPLSLDFLYPFTAANGDILVATLVNGRYVFRPYSVVVPGTTVLRNALVLDNGDTKPTYKPTLDGTNPTTMSPTTAAAPGTSLIYSHRDHAHPASDIASAASLSSLTSSFNTHVAWEQRAVLTSGQQLTSNSAAYQNITQGVIVLGANEAWRFHGTIVGLSTAAADWKFQFTVPAGGVLWMMVGQYVDTAGVLTILSQVAAGTTVAVGGTAANYPVEIMGTVVTVGTAGNMQLQAAQNTATVETTDFIVQGTNIVAWRLY